jgi:xylulokinase
VEVAGAGDQAAAALGVGVAAPGPVSVVLGTSGVVFTALPAYAPDAQARVHTFCHAVPATWHAMGVMLSAAGSAAWLRRALGASFAELDAEAERWAPGAEGLLFAPYLAGERTPIFDPRARGCWVGLTLRHGRGHLFRSTLEAIALGIRHNLDAMAEADARPARLVAVGGGTRGGLLTQITSDVTGLPQDLPSLTIGASYGDARMAADALGVDTGGWNPVARRFEPDPAVGPLYDELYGVYRRSYVALRDELHRLDALAAQASSGG